MEFPDDNHADKYDARNYEDARQLLQDHTPHVLTAILAQHIQHNHRMTESEAWGHAANLVAEHGNGPTMHGILAAQIQKGRDTGRIK